MQVDRIFGIIRRLPLLMLLEDQNGNMAKAIISTVRLAINSWYILFTVLT